MTCARSTAGMRRLIVFVVLTLGLMGGSAAIMPALPATAQASAYPNSRR